MLRKRAGSKIRINYPKPRERISSPDYTFRIETREGGATEVSIDDGPWQSCRPSVGYWWFDWRRVEEGKHTLVARLRAENGGIAKSPARTFRAGAKSATLGRAA